MPAQQLGDAVAGPAGEGGDPGEPDIERGGGRAAGDHEIRVGDEPSGGLRRRTSVTSWVQRRPSAMLAAMTCVFPYIDS